MAAAPIPQNEAERLAALIELNVLDSAAESEFDALVTAASLVCGTPISLISLIDEERQWFKANVGLSGVTETSRELAFCAHAIMQDDLLIVPDASTDNRFADNPLVTGEPHIRFYAGAPLMHGEFCLGTLCVVDRKPRVLGNQQCEILRSLALVAAKSLQTRTTVRLLEAERQRLALVLEASNAGSWELNVQTGDARVSTLWTSIIGIDASDLPVATREIWEEHVHLDDLPRSREALERHVQGIDEHYECEYRLRHREGHYVWILGRGRISTWTPDGTPEWVFGTYKEITERKEREEALRRSEEFLDRVSRVAGVGGWELQIDSRELRWSEETCRIHGGDIGHRPTLDEALQFYPPEARASIEAAVERCMSQGRGWDLELPLVRADGDRIWVRAVGSVEFDAGKPVRLTGAIQDITTRVLGRQALQRANERITLATDSGRIGIWDWDAATDEMRCDPWMYRLYGIEPSTAVSTPALWHTPVHPEDREQLDQTIARYYAGEGDGEMEFRIVRGDGEVRHLHLSGRIERDSEGRPVRGMGATWDVTEAKQLTAQLAEKHELLRVTLDSIGDAVITTDAAGRVVWLNPVAERMTGWLAAEAAGHAITEIFRIVHEESRETAPSPIAVCLSNGMTVGLAERTVLLARDGREFGIEDSAAPIRNEQGQVLGAVLVFHDVTEQRRMSGEMTFRATHDALTGLVNRAEFEVRLRRALKGALEDQSSHALLYIDLDQFKLVNDACGHAAGDQLLQQIAKLLHETIRSRDTVARLGGDEFAVILDHCPPDRAVRIAQQICDRMDHFRFLYEARRFRIGASIGLVQIDDRWANTAAILQAADTACYAAKEAGRNRVHTWLDTDKALRARHGEMQWTSRIEQALDEDRFELFGQQIASLHGPTHGSRVEVLLRMRNEDGTLVLPGAFLPAAERFHLASRIDRWVLRHVVDWLRSELSHSNLEGLSVNVSGQSIGDREFHRWAIELLENASGDARQRLCVEITETAAVTNMADARLFIDEALRLGVKVALDDFGAGASSYGYLKSLPVDYLKIDGQFVTKLIDDRLDQAAVRSFVDVAKVVGVKTVAEFVDRAEIMNRLREMGVDYAQGFFVHRPAPLGELTAAVDLLVA